MAENSSEINLTLYSPNSQKEYFEVTSPINSSYLNGNIAIFNDKNLYVSIADKTYENKSFNNIKSVKFYDDNNLFILDETLMCFNINTKTTTDILNVNTAYFDINENYLVRIYSNTIYYYQLNGTSIVGDKVEISSKAADNFPICINENNYVFYFDINKNLRYFNIATKEDKALLNRGGIVSMISDANNIYYTDKTEVYVYNLTTNIETKLNAPTSLYDLGKYSTIQGLSFKGDNLLITDLASNSIQEFSINNNNLEFTGFAVAKNKTAFNRIETTATDIEKKGNIKVILDAEKLTIYNDATNIITSKNLTEITKDFVPTCFSLGNGTIILANKNDTKNYAIFEFNGKWEQKSEIISVTNNITDIDYSSGYYYLMTTDGSGSSKIIKINETDIDDTKVLAENIVTGTSPILTADVFGNVYYSDIIDNNIKKLSNSVISPIESLTTENIIKMQTDLEGNLFILYKTNNNSNYLTTYKNGVISTQNIVKSSLVSQDTYTNSFALDFETNDVYFIYENEELVFSTIDLDNVSINNLKVLELKLTDKTANENFEVYSINDGANVYAINIDDDNISISFSELLAIHTNESIKIAKTDNDNFILITIRDTDDITKAKKDYFAIVNVSTITKQSIEQKTATETVYNTIDVDGYYLPIITKNRAYSLVDNEKIVRLSRGTEITNKYTITIFNEEFYLSTFTVNGNEYTGYIPVRFTVEHLTEDFVKENYSIETVTQCKVYDVEGNEKAQLESGTQVKTYENKDGKTYIAYKVANGEYEYGYINTSSIVKASNNNLVVAIIICAAAAACFVTTLYFIFRKKRN